MDYTLNQTEGEQVRAEELSLRATVPPAQVPGYRLDRLLGQGAFGQVWVGYNLNTGRTVAIKFYLHRSGVNWSLLTREVKNLVSMSSNRSIVQVLEVGWDSEPPYYVMEYLENGSLDDLIHSRGVIPMSRAMELFFDIATGLNHSHGKGVLHCDLKPANVLLDSDMQPRLADFGQSRLSTEQTPSLGTLFYMAPEQADLNAIPDVRWDVYALGAILYCMLVGSPPYKSPDTVTTLDTAASLPERLKRYRDTIYKSHFPRAHHRVPGMDNWLVSIIDRCIAKKPEDRFENVQQVLAELNRRREARMSRPLLLLGIVGPILLILVMGFFELQTVTVASTNFLRTWQENVLERNQYNAHLAAKNLQIKVATLFELIDSEVQRDEFRDKVFDCVEQAGGDLLHSLATEKKPPPESKEALLQLESRKVLDDYLASRLKHLQSPSSDSIQESERTDKFDSIFVTDRFGTMLAAAFASDPKTHRIGENFAYRSYFNGQSQDLDERTPCHHISSTETPHLSVPFFSNSTERWKIAVSTPYSIEREDPDTHERTVVHGVLVLTINLGNFQLLTESLHRNAGNSNGSELPVQHERFAVLVDGHEGDREGTLLQHPGLSKIDLQSPRGASKKFQIEGEMFKRLKESGSDEYIDPISRDEIGKAYRGKWIAAMVRVDSSPRISDSLERKQSAKSTNLWVLVQERTESTEALVAQFEIKLRRIGVIALVSLIAIIVALWVVVIRVLRLPDSFAGRIHPRTGGGTELTGTANEATLDAER